MTFNLWKVEKKYAESFDAGFKSEYISGVSRCQSIQKNYPKYVYLYFHLILILQSKIAILRLI